MSKTQQLEFTKRGFKKRGGARKGAGRKPNGSQPGVSHLKRPKVTKSYPVFVTQRIKGGLPNLRFKKNHAIIEQCIQAHNEHWSSTFRIVDYVVIGNHIHLLVEASNNSALSKGLQGLFIRISKRLNSFWNRRGSIFVDRYDARVLTSPREVRNRLHYLYNNARKHGYRLGDDHADPKSSGPWFDGWRYPPINWLRDRRVTAEPKSWLRAKGWRRHGLLVPTG